jgi:hypothetical protein
LLPCPEVERWTPNYRRADELVALTSESVRRVVGRLGISLVNYRDLSTLIARL